MLVDPEVDAEAGAEQELRVVVVDALVDVRVPPGEADAEVQVRLDERDVGIDHLAEVGPVACEELRRHDRDVVVDAHFGEQAQRHRLEDAIVTLEAEQERGRAGGEAETALQ
jgi:hypothetical protein